MDAYLAVVSKRDEDRYADRPVPDDVLERILDAGRLAGSASNRQPWAFVVVESRERVERLAELVYEPQNVRTAALVVAVVATSGRTGFDHGRAAQNMMLAAWNDGVVSSPNGLADRDPARDVLELTGDEAVAIVLTFGYPARPRDAAARSPGDWSARANRRPLGELVRRV